MQYDAVIIRSVDNLVVQFGLRDLRFGILQKYFATLSKVDEEVGVQFKFLAGRNYANTPNKF